MELTADTHESHERRNGAKFDVLQVEDRPLDALFVKFSLEPSSGSKLEADFQLETVNRVSKAIEYLEQRKFDAILLDLNLPDASGLEALVKLRNYVQRVPTIVFTGLDNELLGIMALQHGAQDYLVKGVSTERLVNSIRYAIARMQYKACAWSSCNHAPNINDYTDHGSSRSYVPEIVTVQELQVLKLLEKGRSVQEIAEYLSIPLPFIELHIKNLLDKLSVDDYKAALVEAHERQII